ncbi:hypothetical protein N798_15875 [Knoellia flava TL1]|uniref:Uncharacterized protein n=1 Tax=Knoellia flava TL1 TaxID=1385518 RepID=A0ABR4XA04_9MICO|nr:hypothetical protein N798_15875 [Knoellia flava TL1]
MPAPGGGRGRTGPRWLTDGGLETDLVFHHGVELPRFAAYPLLDSPRGQALLTDYFSGYADVAARVGAGLLLETPTWRANPDWITAVGGAPDDVRRVNVESVVLLAALGESLIASGVLPSEGSDYASFRVSGTIGPRGDGYVAGEQRSADEFAT